MTRVMLFDNLNYIESMKVNELMNRINSAQIKHGLSYSERVYSYLIELQKTLETSKKVFNTFTNTMHVIERND
jgi:hypothetical protein